MAFQPEILHLLHNVMIIASALIPVYGIKESPWILIKTKGSQWSIMAKGELGGPQFHIVDWFGQGTTFLATASPIPILTYLTKSLQSLLRMDVTWFEQAKMHKTLPQQLEAIVKIIHLGLQPK